MVLRACVRTSCQGIQDVSLLRFMSMEAPLKVFLVISSIYLEGTYHLQIMAHLYHLWLLSVILKQTPELKRVIEQIP